MKCQTISSYLIQFQSMQSGLLSSDPQFSLRPQVAAFFFSFASSFLRKPKMNLANNNLLLCVHTCKKKKKGCCFSWGIVCVYRVKTTVHTWNLCEGFLHRLFFFFFLMKDAKCCTPRHTVIAASTHHSSCRETCCLMIFHLQWEALKCMNPKMWWPVQWISSIINFLKL